MTEARDVLSLVIDQLRRMCPGEWRNLEADTTTFCTLDRGHDGPCDFSGIVWEQVSKPVPVTLTVGRAKP